MRHHSEAEFFVKVDCGRIAGSDFQVSHRRAARPNRRQQLGKKFRAEAAPVIIRVNGNGLNLRRVRIDFRARAADDLPVKLGDKEDRF